MEKIKKNYQLILAIIFSEFLFISFALPINPDDYWWHVKMGEWIANNNTIQKTEIYSWAANLFTINWIDHSWTAEVPMYWLDCLFKDLAPLIFLLISGVIVYIAIFKVNSKYYEKNKNAFIIFSFFYFVIFQKMLAPRPYILGLAFLIFLLQELENIRKHNKMNYLKIIILIILWTNNHGASIVLSFLFIGYYLFFSLFNIENKYIKIPKQTNEQKIKYAITLALSFLCSFVNPYGAKSVFYIFQHDKIATQFIYEWQNVITTKSFFIIGLCVVAGFFLFKKIKEMETQDTLIIIGLIFLSLYCIRYAMYLIALFPIFLLRYYEFNNKSKKINSFIRILGYMSIIMFIFALMSAPKLTYKSISDEMIEVIKEEQPERIFNEYMLGGYLMYNDVPVFWDARADLYRNSILLDSFLAQLNDETLNKQYNFNPEEFINKYNFDYILLTKTSKMNEYIKSLNYEIIKEDDMTILYKQK